MKGRAQGGREWRSSLACRPVQSFALALLAALLAPALAQAAKPGDLDPSFGGDGKVTTNFGHYNAAYAAAIDSHGRVIAVGSDFDLARYRRDGELDRSFSGDGRVTGFGGSALAVVIDSRGRIVVAGNEECDFNSTTSSFVLARYKPNGTLDPSLVDPATTDFAGYPCADANSSRRSTLMGGLLSRAVWGVGWNPTGEISRSLATSPMGASTPRSAATAR